MTYDYERRRVARAQSVELFEDEVDGVLDTAKNVQSYGKTMGQALALLRPVTECLKSKPLAKVYVELKGALDALPQFTAELRAIQADFERLDAECLLEVQRIRGSAEPVKIPDVRVPHSLLLSLAKRVQQYNAKVEKTFDVSFSLDEVGTAGSPDLKSYERLLERAGSWEELSCPEVPDIGGLAEYIHDRAKEP